MSIAIVPGSYDPITLGHLDVIERALSLYDEVVVAVMINDQKSYRFSLSERAERQHRRAFSGTLCSHNVRADLEVEYISLRRTDGLRRTVSLAVKYTENVLRAVLGIRARLSATGLDADVRRVIDRYFDAVRSSLPSRNPTPETPAYEKLYDAPERGIDRDSARRIEASSWQLTRRLVTEEELSDAPPAPADAPPFAEIPPIAKAPAVMDAAPAEAPSGEDSAALFEAVSAFLLGGTAPEGVARRRAIPLPLLAEEVNEAFLAAYGDILLEPSENGYTLIEDYREDTEEWLKTLTT